MGPSLLFRQLLAGLLAHHIFRVPVGPVLIPFAEELFVFAVGGFGAAKRTGQVLDGRERRRRRVDAARQTCGDLLEQPAVAVGIMERGTRAVTAMIGIGTADAPLAKQVRLVVAGVHAAFGVENLAD